jgi:hypothetical protein
MTKGEKYQLKLEGLALFYLVLFCLEKPDWPVFQTELSDFAQQNFHLFFFIPCFSGLRTL